MLSHRATSRLRTVRRATALAAVAVLSIGGTAVADDISNNLDGSIDATVETSAMTVGGTSNVTLFVNQTGSGPNPADGKSGCNLTGSSTLGLNVASSAPTVASVSPGSITFTSCGDTKSLSIQALNPGTTRISVTQTSNNTGGTFNLAPATFDVVVSPAQATNTPPTVSVTGVDSTSYAKGSVPTAGCAVQDAEDEGESAVPVVSGTLDADGLGEQTVSCSYTDGGGLIDSDSVTYTIDDPSAPTIGYTLNPTSPDGLDSWYRGDVTLTWNVSESESPNSLDLTGCQDQVIDADQLATDYSCSATSSGGGTGPVTATVKRDGNGPVVSYDATQTAAPDGENGWYVSPVTATFTASDDFSGVSDASTRTVNSAGDGAAVSIQSPAFSDNAGNTTGAGAAQAGPFKVDTVAPSVDDAVLAGTLGNNGWYVSDVEASFTGHDTTSGVVGTNPRTVSSGGVQGEMTLQSPQFSDAAGNTTPAGAKSAAVKVDTVAPSVKLLDGPDGSYFYGSVPAPPTCDTSDATSGLAGDCTVSGYGTTVGSHTLEAVAVDRAGNKTVVTRTYTVLAWTGKGFYAPVDMGGVYNTVKGGSTVPLKFELFAGQTELTDVAAVKSFNTAKVSCTTGAGDDAIEITSTGGTSLRYDTTGGQFIQNWKTPTGAGTCYRATMTAQDGTSISALFKIK